MPDRYDLVGNIVGLVLVFALPAFRDVVEPVQQASLKDHGRRHGESADSGVVIIVLAGELFVDILDLADPAHDKVHQRFGFLTEILHCKIDGLLLGQAEIRLAVEISGDERGGISHDEEAGSLSAHFKAQ